MITTHRPPPTTAPLKRATPVSIETTHHKTAEPQFQLKLFTLGIPGVPSFN
ncbi:hypothetical protein A8926_2068 [Saccharopolyspora spinosa]|uniref:Uncharacterized protein n=1 Tax=Saccharopolyspora spinosa TaxID=60894 RepID=A0A2N3XV10_SACSN|nr:hypothetical protein A8926_2068 [Saccharopolyspora spinosa]